jgi:hypothetical protein
LQLHVVNFVGFALTIKKNVRDAAFMKAILHGVNVNYIRVFQSMVLSIADYVQIFHATFKLDILTQIIPKVRETL